MASGGWTWHVDGPDGWTCFPDGDYADCAPNADDSAWDAMIRYLHEIGEQREPTEEFQMLVMRREIEEVDCENCCTPECAARRCDQW